MAICFSIHVLNTTAMTHTSGFTGPRQQSQMALGIQAATYYDLPMVTQAVRSIPDSWESISKNELLLADQVSSATLTFLLQQDVIYCSTTEQDKLYRQLLDILHPCH